MLFVKGVNNERGGKFNDKYELGYEEKIVDYLGIQGESLWWILFHTDGNET